MHFDNRHYIIFDMSEAASINFSEVMEMSLGTIRKSLDGSQSCIKFVGDMPPTVTALTTRSQEYSIEQIRVIMADPEWSPNTDDLL